MNYKDMTSDELDSNPIFKPLESILFSCL